jgi:hypothetical protein
LLEKVERHVEAKWINLLGFLERDGSLVGRGSCSRPLRLREEAVDGVQSTGMY